MAAKSSAGGWKQLLVWVPVVALLLALGSNGIDAVRYVAIGVESNTKDMLEVKPKLEKLKEANATSKASVVELRTLVKEQGPELHRLSRSVEQAHNRLTRIDTQQQVQIKNLDEMRIDIKELLKRSK